MILYGEWVSAWELKSYLTTFQPYEYEGDDLQKPRTILLHLSAKGESDTHSFTDWGMTRPGIDPESTAPEFDSLPIVKPWPVMILYSLFQRKCF